MTPKEKAKELVEKFRMYDIIICDLMFDELYGYEESHYKQCALIAVDEILNSINPFGQFLGKDYWQEVKQEIEKL